MSIESCLPTHRFEIQLTVFVSVIAWTPVVSDPRDDKDTCNLGLSLKKITFTNPLYFHLLSSIGAVIPIVLNTH
jgi:hypothetical protein